MSAAGKRQAGGSPASLDGARFEVWCRQLLSDLGYSNVRRNVCYYRGKEHRQVDVEYFSWLSLFEHFVIFEAKYSSDGNVEFAIKPKQKGKSKIKKLDNIVVELEERRRFVSADAAIIASNTGFEGRVYDEAKRYGIRVYDGQVMEKLDKKRRWPWPWAKPLDEQVRSIDLRKYGKEHYVVRI